ncbi:MAG: four helix bundle protein [Candidatus Uhrbacteria bacterium]
MYRQVIAWQKSMELVPVIYDLTDLLPDSEKYGLFSQMRRCVVSIPSNIAEGKMRGSRKEYLQFLVIARASAAELETQLKILEIIKLDKNTYFPKAASLLNEVIKILNSIISTIREQIENGVK